MEHRRIVAQELASLTRQRVTMLFPTLPQILQIYLLALLLSTLAGVVLSEAWGSLPPRLGILIVELSFFTIILLFVRRMAFKAEDIFLLNAVSRRSLVVSGVVAVSANVLVTEVDDALMELARNAGIGFPLYLQRLLLDIQLVSDFATLGESLLAVVLVPGILEEIAFRGFVFAGLCFYRGPVVAVLGSSLLFASFHLDPWHFPAVFLLGIVFGVLVWLTHSIYPAVLAHVTNNLFCRRRQPASPFGDQLLGRRVATANAAAGRIFVCGWVGFTETRNADRAIALSRCLRWVTDSASRIGTISRCVTNR